MKYKVTNINYCIEPEDVTDPEDIDDEISDIISDKTGWLVNGFDFEKSEEN